MVKLQKIQDLQAYQNALEDFVIAIILSNGEIIKTQSGNSIIFTLDERKSNIVENYIANNKLGEQIKYNRDRQTGIIKPSIIVEKLIRNWTMKKQIVAMNPSKIKISTLFLWICLFGRKTKKNVIIDTNIPVRLHDTLEVIFHNIFGIPLKSNGDFFYIRPFYLIMLEALKLKLSIPEMLELNYLLPQNEREKLLQELTYYNEEGWM